MSKNTLDHLFSLVVFVVQYSLFFLSKKLASIRNLQVIDPLVTSLIGQNGKG